AVIKTIVTAGLTQLTGATVHIRTFSINFLSSSILAKGLKVYNPAGFPSGEILADIPNIELEYDRSALFKRRLHLPYLYVDLKELLVTKNKEGQISVDSLKFFQKDAKPRKKTGNGEPARIGLLKLKIGKLIHKDFSSGEKPVVKVYDINTSKAYKDIPGGLQLAALVLAEPLKQAAIKGAKVYGIAAAAGVAVLPAGVAGIFVSKDSAKADFDTTYIKAYTASLEAIKELGKVTEANQANGFIRGIVRKALVKIEISKASENTFSVTASARLFLIPKPSTAESLLYEISRRLNQ
ncbi:MAG: hypothetical protein PHI60_06630, partial [Candidatus Omnitrophica bacterium]|nr:hypothetical protein [Candidatus Omnitrophota bacterium]